MSLTPRAFETYGNSLIDQFNSGVAVFRCTPASRAFAKAWRLGLLTNGTSMGMGEGSYLYDDQHAFNVLLSMGLSPLQVGWRCGGVRVAARA